MAFRKNLKEVRGQKESALFEKFLVLVGYIDFFKFFERGGGEGSLAFFPRVG